MPTVGGWLVVLADVTLAVVPAGTGNDVADNIGIRGVRHAVDVMIQSGRTIDAIGLDGWRIDVGYPEDRDEAEQRLQDDSDVESDTADASAASE